MCIRAEFNVLLHRSLAILLGDISPSPAINALLPCLPQDNQSSSPTLDSSELTELPQADSPMGWLQRRLSPLCFWATVRMTFHICILGTVKRTSYFPSLQTAGSPLLFVFRETTLAAGQPAAVSLCHQEAEPAVCEQGLTHSVFFQPESRVTVSQELGLVPFSDFL